MDVRAAIARFGLKVVCLVCGIEGRHRPEKDGRLRKRRCPSCGAAYALRSRAWLVKPGNEGAARKAAAEARQLARVLR